MKIISPNQIKTVDRDTVLQDSISSIDLMERASKAFVKYFANKYTSNYPVTIFCGPGNNGGDGLAIARLLKEQNYSIQVYILATASNYSEDHCINKKRLVELGIDVIDLFQLKDLLLIPSSAIIIDALFGYGLNKPLAGFTNELVIYINSLPNKCISVDMPSGLFANISTTGNAIQADEVISFQFPKLSFLLPDSAKWIKDWIIIDIALSNNSIANQSTSYEYQVLEDIQSIYQTRARFSHKGSHGHLLLLAGSEGKVGAALLAGKAALRSGIGLLTLFLPKPLIPIAQSALPEAMCSIASEEELLGQLSSYSTIGIGPGWGQELTTLTFFTSLLNRFHKPVIIDADGLNLLSAHPDLLNTIPKNSILTPHPGEFRRLVGDWKNDFDKLDLLQSLARKHQLIIVLKGANTCICNSNGHCYFNSTGNSGMATAGSGDTLTGIIAGLLAQGYSPIQAARLGVFLHGLAGDIAIRNSHENALIASDITQCLGKAFQEINQ